MRYTRQQIQDALARFISGKPIEGGPDADAFILQEALWAYLEMTKPTRGVEWMAEGEHPGGVLASNSFRHVEYEHGDNRATLKGNFSAIELESLTRFMRQHRVKPTTRLRE